MLSELKYKIGLYITLTRPMGWAPFYFPLLLGLIDSGFSTLIKVYLTLLIYGPLLTGGIYVLNFYSDIEADRTSKVTKDLEMSKQPFVTGEVSRREGLLLAITLIIFGLILSLLINIQVFIISLISVFLGIIYSFPPRLKQVPLADILVNSLVGGLCYMAGWSVFKDIYEISIYPILWLIFLISATYLLTVIIDIDADKQAGLRTTAVFLGSKRAVRVSFWLYIFSIILFIIVLKNQINLAYIILIPLLIKSPYTYYKLYKNPLQVYDVGRRATLKSVKGVLILLLIYSTFSLVGIDDKTILLELIRI